MTMNPNWSRWIFASMSKFFDSKKQGLNLYIEGTDKKGRRDDQDYAEFRMNGPYGIELSSNYWKLTFEINVLVSATKDADAHKIHKDVGIVTQMFESSVPIYKYGDDGALIDCALIQTPEGIYINHYGQPDLTSLILQSSVEATYTLILDT